MDNDKRIDIYKESFISKIKSFFRKLFNNHEMNPNMEPVTNAEPIVKMEKNEQKVEFNDRLKVDKTDIDLMYEKEEFLKQIEGNKEALRQLSTDRLERLLQYYNKKIEENDKIIEKLKANS